MQTCSCKNDLYMSPIKKIFEDLSLETLYLLLVKNVGELLEAMDANEESLKAAKKSVELIYLTIIEKQENPTS